MSQQALFLRGKSQFAGHTKWHVTGSDTLTLCGYPKMLAPYEAVYEHPERGMCLKCICALLEYKTETIRAGQTRKYGPTINTYHVTDIKGDRDKNDVLDFCRTYLYRAKLKGDDGFHPLTPHVMKFSRRSNGSWLYEAGHEYTG